MASFGSVAAALYATVETSRAALLAISEEEAGRRSGPENWSKKEILGHLIDSASNNHQRFVRLQNADTVVLPSYQENDWVRTQHYGARPWTDLVELWSAYNRHLAHVIRHADEKAAGHVWKLPDRDYNLGFLIEDYLTHMQHHLAQITHALTAA